jgi:hypothetical protein
MATMPGLIIKVGANVGDALSGLNKVNRAMGQSATRSQRMSASLAKVGPALGLAAAAAGALAVKVGVDSVKAFMDDQKSVEQFNVALRNMGFESATARATKFIDNLQFSANVVDDELRPAYSRLLRASGSVTTAQNALSLALDVSAGTGKDLATVSTALARGYAGSATGLSRLNAGLDKNLLKSGDMVAISAELVKKFGGANEARTNTLSGAIAGVDLAWGELQESFGKGLTLGDAGTGKDSVKQLQEVEQKLRDAQPAAEALGTTAHDTALDFGNLLDVGSAVGDLWNRGSRWDAIKLIFQTNGEAARQTAKEVHSLGTEFAYTQYEGYRAKNTLADYVTSAESTESSSTKAATAVTALQKSLERLSGKRDLIREGLDMQALLGQGAGKSGRRKLMYIDANGTPQSKDKAFSTVADRKQYALDVADAREKYASDLLGAGKPGQARKQLALARADIKGMNLPGDFKASVLSTLRTPDGMRYVSPPQAGTPGTGAQVAAINYIFNGDLLVKSPADAVEQAKRAVRLQRLGRGNSAAAQRYAGMAAAS